MSGHTDIRTSGWVARLPQAWRPYALLMRLDRPIGSWLLFLPGLWAFAMVAPDWRQGLWLTAFFGLGAVLMRGAGCVVNDLWDRDLDRQVERTAGRPLASGALRARHALVFLALVLAVALLILLQLNRTAQVLGVASLIPVVLYPLAKRVTDWPQAVLGVIFSWAAPMGYAAVTVDQVVKVLFSNADKARALVQHVVPSLGAQRGPCPAGCDRALEHALITAPEKRDPDLLAKLDVVAKRVLG